MSKAKLRNVMKTAALDAEEHRGRIDAVIAAHKRKSSGNSGIGIEDGIVREGAMTSYGSGCLETDPLIAKGSGNDGICERRAEVQVKKTILIFHYFL